jgi:hypothetical protein
MGLFRKGSGVNRPIRNNQTKPNQTQSRPYGAAGVSRSRIQVNPNDRNDGMPPWSERRKELLDYVARVLPDENVGLAASAALSIRLTGKKATPDAILERLRASGRSADQLRAKGWVR